MGSPGKPIHFQPTMSRLPPYAGSASIPSSTFWRNIEKKSALVNAVEPPIWIAALPVCKSVSACVCLSAGRTVYGLP